MQVNSIPGAGIAIVSKDSVIFLGGLGYANMEDNIPVTDTTCFRMGSITKSFIALGFLKLAEEGRIDLNTPVKEIVPEINIINPWQETDPVRVAHILEHTSGFGNSFREFNLDDDPRIPLRQALDKVDKRYDAIVVDEGQDFFSEWWLPLELLNTEGDKGPFYVFYDPAQNLFVQDDLSTPDLGTPYELPTNCRNTKHIADVCSRVRGIDIKVRADAPEGTKCEVLTAETAEKQKGYSCAPPVLKAEKSQKLPKCITGIPKISGLRRPYILYFQNQSVFIRI